MKEIWKAIEGFEDFYEVSDQGRVRSLTRTIQFANQFGPCSKLILGRVLRCGLVPMSKAKRSWCRHAALCVEGEDHQRRVSRLVFEAFCGPLQPTDEVWHRNGDSLDDRAVNLQRFSAEEASSLNNPMLTRGEASPQAKLTAAKIKAISREAREHKRTNVEIGEEHGISASVVSNIKTKKTWCHVRRPLGKRARPGPIPK